MKQRLFALALGLATCGASSAAPEINVDVLGQVRNPGVQVLPVGARLSDAALAAQPLPNAYPLAAAWLRQAEQLAQTRLKAGVLFDLGQLEERADRDPDGAQAATALAREIDSMPVTGRVPALLAARNVEAALSQNRPLADGDRLVYPPRPATVTVMGAVAQQCVLEHVSDQEPRAYLSHCPTLAAASRDDLYVIQPDGHVEKLGIALWNRSPASTLAPGAIVYVPLQASTLGQTAPDLNEEVARFLATQVLDAPGVTL